MKPVHCDNAPRDYQEKIKKTIKKGLIIVNTGDGKGKSTAAFGTALRAIGSGHKVAIVQFIKGNWKTGESQFFKKFCDNCEIFTMGEGFTWETQNFEQDVKTAQRAWAKCCELLHDEKYFLVIFDEINYVMHYNFLNVEDVIKELQKKSPAKHVILTGRYAPKSLIDLADLVTEMKCIKHPYQQGIKAQHGIEF